MKNKILLLYKFLFVLLCCSIPYFKIASAVPNICLIGLIALFPFVVKKEDFRKFLKMPFYIFGGLVLFLIVNMLFFQEVKLELKIIQKLTSVVALILFSIPLNNLTWLKKGIVGSVGLCVFISLIKIGIYIVETNNFEFAEGNIIRDLLLVDRLYFGFFCIVSILSSLSLFQEKIIEKKWLLINITINVLFVLLISSRIAVFLLIILAITSGFYTKQKLKMLFTLFGLAIVLITAFSINKNLGERFFYTQSEDSNKSYIELAKIWEPRFVIWSCAMDIGKNETNLWLGNGFYKTKDKLVNCYDRTISKEDRRTYFIAQRFNPHNQFIDFTLSYGFIAGSFFMVLFILLLLKYYKNFITMGYVMSLASFCLIECIFHRQMGAYYFGIVFILLVFNSNHSKDSSN